MPSVKRGLNIAAKTGLRTVPAIAALLLSATGVAEAQELRFHLHRDVGVPEYAFVRIGPFYSDIRFAQSAGYRYTTSRGAGTDYLRDQRRGRIRKDGSEWPLISTLDFRNRLLLTRNADVDLSVRVRFEHYPLGTQEDVFLVSLPDEAITGNFSTSFRLTPYLRGTIYDRFLWRTDYIDTRGVVDELGGRKYEFISNVIGLDGDWLMAPDKNLSFSASRADYWPQSREFRDQKRTVWRESLAYSQRLRPWLTGGLRAEFSQIDYDARHRQDYDSHLYSVFADMRVTRRVTASGWAGYSIVRTGSGEGSRDREAANWGLNLKAREGFWLWAPQLTHEVGADRTVAEGFDTAYQTTDRYFYRARWDGTVFQAAFTAELREVDPSDPRINGYRDTVYRLDASYPLFTFARLHGAAGYTLRRNERIVVVDPEDPPPVDRSSDYDTLFWRLGTGFRITRRIDFDTYYQHNERLSKTDDLKFERDTFHAALTFQHRF